MLELIFRQVTAFIYLCDSKLLTEDKNKIIGKFKKKKNKISKYILKNTTNNTCYSIELLKCTVIPKSGENKETNKKYSQTELSTGFKTNSIICKASTQTYILHTQTRTTD